MGAMANMRLIPINLRNVNNTRDKHLDCEIQTLGYPKATLSSFCLAWVAGNILAVVEFTLANLKLADAAACQYGEILKGVLKS